MPQAHCMRCKKKVEMVNSKESKMKNGKDILKGECPTCHSKVNTFVSKKNVDTKVDAEVKPKRKYVRKAKVVVPAEPTHTPIKPIRIRKAKVTAPESPAQ